MIMIVEMIWGIAPQLVASRGDRAPGDFGFDPLNFKGGKMYDTLQAREVANGRLAMFAAMGLLVQGSTAGEGGVEELVARSQGQRLFSARVRARVDG
jgi:light-harvesting complex I chlorophyll a/b binding protein 1